MQARKGVQIYLAEPTLFADRLGKRWFYATHEGRIIGFAILNKLESQEGWLLNNVMVEKDSPSGVSEHPSWYPLFKQSKKNSAALLLIGPVPAKDLGKIIGLGRPIVLLAALCFKAIKKICHLDGHEIFWDKFQPELKSSYLLFPKNRFRISSIPALLRALNISVKS